MFSSCNHTSPGLWLYVAHCRARRTSKILSAVLLWTHSLLWAIILAFAGNLLHFADCRHKTDNKSCNHIIPLYTFIYLRLMRNVVVVFCHKKYAEANIVRLLGAENGISVSVHAAFVVFRKSWNPWESSTTMTITWRPCRSVDQQFHISSLLSSRLLKYSGKPKNKYKSTHNNKRWQIVTFVELGPHSLEWAHAWSYAVGLLFNSLADGSVIVRSLIRRMFGHMCAISRHSRNIASIACCIICSTLTT